MSYLTISIGISDNPRTRPLIDDRVRPEGTEPVFTVLHPSELFWRQLKFGEFDVAEMSLSTWLRLVDRGQHDHVGVPVFTTRQFFHTMALVRTDAGIERPQDLRGKRVGVPEYQQTAALWSRGVLQHEFGVHPSEMEFWMERTPELSHAGAGRFEPPPGVVIHQIPADKDIGAMMASGELDATLLYLPVRNLVDRSRIDLNAHAGVRPLFPDARAEHRRYFASTGLFPINHLVVLKRSVFERYPWLAINLFKAFEAANDLVERERLALERMHVDSGLLDDEAVAALTRRLVRYGIAANRAELETVAAYSHEQGLISRPLDAQDLFAPSLQAS